MGHQPGAGPAAVGQGPVVLWKPAVGVRASLRLGVLGKVLGGRDGSARPAAGTGECSGWREQHLEAQRLQESS